MIEILLNRYEDIKITLLYSYLPRFILSINLRLLLYSHGSVIVTTVCRPAYYQSLYSPSVKLE